MSTGVCPDQDGHAALGGSDAPQDSIESLLANASLASHRRNQIRAEWLFWAIYCDLVTPAAFVFNPLLMGCAFLWAGSKTKGSENFLDLFAG